MHHPQDFTPIESLFFKIKGCTLAVDQECSATLELAQFCDCRAF